MNPTIVLLALVAAVSGRTHVTFIGTDEDIEYPVYCDKKKSPIENIILIDGEGPKIQVNSGKASVNGFPTGKFLIDLMYSCKLQDSDEALDVLVTLIQEPENPQVTEEEYDLDEARPQTLATCSSGYAYPPPSIEWVNDQGEVISDCNVGSGVSENDCWSDYKGASSAEKNRYLSATIDFSLSAQVSTSTKYECRIVYQALEDGESVERHNDIAFPSKGCIGVCPKAIITDLPVETPADENINTRGDSQPSDPTSKPVTDATELNAAGNGNRNYMIGGITVLIVIVIIVVAIIYIKKRKNNEDPTQYKPGETA